MLAIGRECRITRRGFMMQGVMLRISRMDQLNWWTWQLSDGMEEMMREHRGIRGTDWCDPLQSEFQTQLSGGD